MYQKISNSNDIRETATGRVIPFDVGNFDYQQVQAWLDAGNVLQDAPVPTVLEVDTEKYLRRANAKPLLMAEMAAMNVARIKNGTWTVAQLTALMQDEQIKALIAHMETLSFELAIGVIQGLTNPLITTEIKSAWTARLVAKL